VDSSKPILPGRPAARQLTARAAAPAQPPGPSPQAHPKLPAPPDGGDAAAQARTRQQRADPGPQALEHRGPEVVYVHAQPRQPSDPRDRRRNHLQRWRFRGVDELRRQQHGDDEADCDAGPGELDLRI
jgi:hypothetical protein